jgi:hypothetical protein
MEELFTALVIVPILVFAVIGGIMVTTGSLDTKVIRACKEQGYWQSGQTRVICSVEVPTKK